MSEQVFSALYLILFLASLTVIILLGVVLYRANRILKSTEKVTSSFSDGLTKLISAALNVVTVSKGIEKIVEILEERYIDKKETKK